MDPSTLRMNGLDELEAFRFYKKECHPLEGDETFCYFIRHFCVDFVNLLCYYIKRISRSMSLLLLMEITISVVFFYNKYLVLQGKKSGWFWGALAATMAIFYFHQVDMHVFAAMQGGLVVLMGYGMFPENWKRPQVELALISVIILTLLILGYMIAIGEVTLQLVASVGIILGTHCLTHKKMILGWSAYLNAHCFAAYVCWKEQLYVISFFQALSAVVSIVALVRLEKKTVSS